MKLVRTPILLSAGLVVPACSGEEGASAKMAVGGTSDPGSGTSIGGEDDNSGGAVSSGGAVGLSGSENPGCSTTCTTTTEFIPGEFCDPRDYQSNECVVIGTQM